MLIILSLIHRYHLQKVGARIQIEETNPNSKNSLLQIQASHSMGFSLDKAGSQNWGFFTKKSLPKGMAQVCDGILICECKGKFYTLLIDLKSKKVSNANEQILSSLFLCNWLNELISLHKVCTQNISFEFIGLICLAGRKTPRKGGTKHDFIVDNTEVIDYRNTKIKIHTFKNQGIISIENIIEKSRQ